MTNPRRVALDALVRIERDAAFANILLPHLLDGTDLDRRDRGLVTDLVYGVTRMRRACDFAVERYVQRPPGPEARAALRIGAYQLLYAGLPAHAAVSTAVGVAPRRERGFVNAVLRRLADRVDVDGAALDWPDEATRLSYPDWLVDRMIADLGRADALATLERMNEPPAVTERADGYVQDRASQWVVEAVDAQAGEVVADVCAAPGGKATAIADRGATVLASDGRFRRARLLHGNVTRLGATSVRVLAADATILPYRDARFDRVLVDAPCSGLGTLRRRPDARWRIAADDIERLADLQQRMLDEAARVVRVGGLVVYSVCTLTSAETVGIDDWLMGAHPELEPEAAPPAPWRPHGRGSLLLPPVADTDGMALFLYRRIA